MTNCACVQLPPGDPGNNSCVPHAGSLRFSIRSYVGDCTYCFLMMVRYGARISIIILQGLCKYVTIPLGKVKVEIEKRFFYKEFKNEII